jgi:hypothetical protein
MFSLNRLVALTLPQGGRNDQNKSCKSYAISYIVPILTVSQKSGFDDVTKEVKSATQTQENNLRLLGV